jgi:hypothetical protein
MTKGVTVFNKSCNTRNHHDHSAPIGFEATTTEGNGFFGPDFE